MGGGLSALQTVEVHVSVEGVGDRLLLEDPLVGDHVPGQLLGFEGPARVGEEGLVVEHHLHPVAVRFEVATKPALHLVPHPVPSPPVRFVLAGIGAVGIQCDEVEAAAVEAVVGGAEGRLEETQSVVGILLGNVVAADAAELVIADGAVDGNAHRGGCAPVELDAALQSRIGCAVRVEHQVAGGEDEGGPKRRDLLEGSLDLAPHVPELAAFALKLVAVGEVDRGVAQIAHVPVRCEGIAEILDGIQAEAWNQHLVESAESEPGHQGRGRPPGIAQPELLDQLVSADRRRGDRSCGRRRTASSAGCSASARSRRRHVDTISRSRIRPDG